MVPSTVIDKSLDALEHECQLLLALLRDRHIGLMTWRFIVNEKMDTVTTMIADLRGDPNETP